MMKPVSRSSPTLRRLTGSANAVLAFPVQAHGLRRSTTLSNMSEQRRRSWRSQSGSQLYNACLCEDFSLPKRAFAAKGPQLDLEADCRHLLVGTSVGLLGLWPEKQNLHSAASYFGPDYFFNRPPLQSFLPQWNAQIASFISLRGAVKVLKAT